MYPLFTDPRSPLLFNAQRWPLPVFLPVIKAQQDSILHNIRQMLWQVRQTARAGLEPNSSL